MGLKVVQRLYTISPSDGAAGSLLDGPVGPDASNPAVPTLQVKTTGGQVAPAARATQPAVPAIRG